MTHVAALVAILLALSPAAALAQADPFLGTWVLNTAKSKYTPGPMPKSQTTTWEASGKGAKIVTKGVSAEGKPTTVAYTTAYDGKDAVVTGSPDYESAAVTRIDSHTLEVTRKKGGKVVQQARMVVSKDGRTRTVTTTGVNSNGEKINNIAIYEKQSRPTS